MDEFSKWNIIIFMKATICKQITLQIKFYYISNKLFILSGKAIVALGFTKVNSIFYIYSNSNCNYICNFNIEILKHLS